MLQLLLVLVLAPALVLVLALGDEVCVGHAAHQLRKRYVICNSMHVVCCTAVSCSTTGCVGYGVRRWHGCQAAQCTGLAAAAAASTGPSTADR